MQAAHRFGDQHAEENDERELEVSVEEKQDGHDQEHGEREDDFHLLLRGEVLLVFAAPIELVADGQFDRCIDFAARFADRARQIAAFDAELDADVARIGFAVDERRAIFHADVAELAERQILPVGGGDQQILDGVLIAAEGLLHAHHKIELALALNDFADGPAAHGGLHHGVDVADVQAVARQFGTVRGDGQAGLSQLAHHGDFGDAGDLVEDVLDLGGSIFEGLEVLAEDLDGERALETGFGLVHGVFGGLSVVEDDAGEGCELLLHGLDELRLGVQVSPVQALSE